MLYAKGVLAFSPGLPQGGYPGITMARFSQPQRGCVAFHWARLARMTIVATPFGVGCTLHHKPRVAPSAQPWAGRLSPVGATGSVYSVLLQTDRLRHAAAEKNLPTIVPRTRRGERAGVLLARRPGLCMIRTLLRRGQAGSSPGQFAANLTDEFKRNKPRPCGNKPVMRRQTT
jgi:hypothetical protein